MVLVPEHYDLFLQRLHAAHIDPALDKFNLNDTIVAALTPPRGRLGTRVFEGRLDRNRTASWHDNYPLKGSPFQYLPIFNRLPARQPNGDEDAADPGYAFTLERENERFLVRPFSLLYEAAILLAYPLARFEILEETLRLHHQLVRDIAWFSLEQSLAKRFSFLQLAALRHPPDFYRAFARELCELLPPFSYQLQINGTEDGKNGHWQEPFLAGGTEFQVPLPAEDDELLLVLDFPAHRFPDGLCFSWEYEPDQKRMKELIFVHHVQRLFLQSFDTWKEVCALPPQQQVFVLIGKDLSDMKDKISELETRLKSLSGAGQDIAAADYSPFAMFEEEAGKWCIIFEGKRFPTAASPTGLWYMQWLLLHPGSSVNTFDLNSYRNVAKGQKIASFPDSEKEALLHELFQILAQRKLGLHALLRGSSGDKERLRRELTELLGHWFYLYKKGIKAAVEQITDLQFMLSKLPAEQPDFSEETAELFEALEADNVFSSSKTTTSFKTINERVTRNIGNAMKKLREDAHTQHIWEYLNLTLQRDTQPDFWELSFHPERATLSERRTIIWRDRV